MLKLVFLISLVATSLAALSKIDHQLQEALKVKGWANVFVSFDGSSTAINSIRQQNFETRGDKITALRLLLLEHAASSQKNVVELLSEKSPFLSYQSFWINNQIFIRGANLQLVEHIAIFPEVSSIVEEQVFEILHPVEIKESSRTSRNVEWGVSLIQAPEAWGLDGGNNGANVRVATIDTGVRVTHEALRSNFHNKNGWFDPYQGTATPNDQSGHGTHVTGTIAGQGGIGVAPGATWIACKGCPTSACEQQGLISCGEFMLCPTDSNGENADCDQTPHLVSNSWGGPQGHEMFNEVIAAWKEAGIVGLFASGNSGPRCGTLKSFGENPDVIAVGSTASDDSLSLFSSVGPNSFGVIKPEVSAPGASIRSSSHTADDSYRVMSGTSMACPHAAGVVALLKGRDQELSIDDVKRHLTSGIDRDVIPTGQNCGGVNEGTWPNNAFGYGRVNALKALVSILQES